MTAKEALEIAAMHNGGKPLIAPTVHDELPPNCTMYRWWSGECWHIQSQADERPEILRSTRLIIIQRETGRVVYDGDANDEG